MKLKFSQKKFTLIELIAVIIILAIIAVVAVPRYMDLKTEAEEAAADGVFGAVSGGVALDYGQHIASGNTGDSWTVAGAIKGTYIDSADAEGWTDSGTTLVYSGENGDLTITIADGTPPTVSKDW